MARSCELRGIIASLMIRLKKRCKMNPVNLEHLKYQNQSDYSSAKFLQNNQSKMCECDRLNTAMSEAEVSNLNNARRH